MLLSVTLVAFALVSTGLYLRPLWASEHTTLPAFLWLLSALPAAGACAAGSPFEGAAARTSAHEREVGRLRVRVCGVSNRGRRLGAAESARGRARGLSSGSGGAA